MIAGIVYLVGCGLLALAIPFGLDRYGLTKAAELLGRPVTAGKIRFNPFTLRLVAHDLRIGGAAEIGRTTAPEGGSAQAPEVKAAEGAPDETRPVGGEPERGEPEKTGPEKAGPEKTGPQKTEPVAGAGSEKTEPQTSGASPAAGNATAVSSPPIAPAPVASAPMPTALLTIDEFDLNLSILSLRYLAPVVEGLRIVAPTLAVTRDAKGRFDFQDILDRIDAMPSPPPPTQPETEADKAPAKFALHNIELVDGRVAFDDRALGQHHEITAMKLGVPFISTLPADIETEVQPAFAAVIDGSPLNIAGESLPFHASRRTELAVDLKDLAVGPYLGWSPTPLGFTMPDGRLSTRLKIGFVHEPTGNRLTIDGPVVLDDLALDARGGGRLVALKRFEAELAGLEPLASRFPLARVAVDGLDVDLVRAADGSLPIVKAFVPKPTPGARPAAAGPKATADNDALTWSVAKTELTNGRIAFTDHTTSPAVSLDQHDIGIEIGPIGNRQSSPAPVSVTLRQNRDGRIDWKGDVDLAKDKARGKLDVALPGIADYLPYVAAQLAAKAATGPIAVSAAIDADWRKDLALAVSDGKATIDAIALTLADDKADAPSVRLGQFAIDGLGLTLAERRVAIERARLAKADLKIARDPRGQLNLERIMAGAEAPPGAANQASTAPAAPKPGSPKAGAAKAAPESPAPSPSQSPGPDQKRPTPTDEASPTPAVKPGPAWAVAIARVELDDNRLQWLDRATPSPVTVPVSGLSGSIGPVGTDLGQSSQADLKMTIGRNGQVTVKGKAVAEPLGLDLNLGWRNLAIAVVDPYLANRSGIELKRGAANGSGRLRYGGDRARFAGRADIAGFDAAERRTGDELLRWKLLTVSAIDADVATGAPVRGQRPTPDRISIGEVVLADAFARVELSADGHLNLSDLAGSPAEGAPGTKPVAAAKTPAADAPPMQIRIGGVRIENSAGNFTDHFVKPNYSADLTGLNGTISAMASDAPEPAAVDITGMINGDAPITIDGKLNPLGPTLYTDLTASAKGINLPALSPYSAKYAGYAIEKGKLSVDVHYEIEHEKLQASNRIFLDQLTFGQKVDSPDATNLPVQFAIGLLKNSRGEIDLNLPISGSLADPEFSFGGIIWNAFVNLLTKIVTSPFTALASAFGGGDELSWVDFRPGTADLEPESLKRLETISKALADRPALKLDINGRMNPEAEAEAFGKARLEARLQALASGRNTDDGVGAELDDGTGGNAAKGSPGKPGAARPGGAAGAAGEQGTRPGAAAPVTISPAERRALLQRLANNLGVPLTEPPSAPISTANAAAATSPAASGSAPSKPGARPTPEQAQASLERRIAAVLAADPDAQRTLAIRRSQAARDWLTRQGGVDAERIFIVAPKIISAPKKPGGSPAKPAPDAGPNAEGARSDGATSGRDAGAGAGAEDGQCTSACAEFALR